MSTTAQTVGPSDVGEAAEEAIRAALTQALVRGVRLGAEDVAASAILQGVDLELTWAGA